MRRAALAIIAVVAVLACHGFVPTAQAQTTPGCQAVTSTASSAAENEIQFLRNNVRKPQSIIPLTCLAILQSVSALSADMIVNSTIEQVLNAIAGQICNALDNYWNAVLNELKCGISIGGPALGFPGLGAGTVCQFGIGNAYGTEIHLGVGIGPAGGGFYVTGQAVQIDAYSR